MGFQSKLNLHGLKSLAKNPNIPDYHLMVGSAECLKSLPVVSYQDKTATELNAVSLKKMKIDNDKVYDMIASNQLEVNDINGNILSIGAGINKGV